MGTAAAGGRKLEFWSGCLIALFFVLPEIHSSTFKFFTIGSTWILSDQAQPITLNLTKKS